ncbi:MULTISPECIES: hypothetical protein [Marinobacter]|mgnify:CR=1 FL=1|uniref:Uncharacterized protein n=1 Tax=Marinobacter xestospongiae TaxID=994319 RepID=A0ABU3VVF0_9GAMM|nr:MULTISPECIES: hypothetical protein [Marinobacter]MDV2077972.1 hypothetical protein [Marinobacter xestospongiae]UDL06344.1 hypothetical protein J2887_06175 [Marinobacter sp. CA1]
MGLKERRKAKEFQEDRLPALQAKLNKVAKFEVPLEINWDTLSVDDQGDNYDIYWPMVYFEPLINGFKKICDDDMGQEALQEVLQKVVMQNFSDNWSANHWARFDRKTGVLTLNHSPVLNVPRVEEREVELINAIESEL